MIAAKNRALNRRLGFTELPSGCRPGFSRSRSTAEPPASSQPIPIKIMSSATRPVCLGFQARVKYPKMVAIGYSVQGRALASSAGSPNPRKKLDVPNPGHDGQEHSQETKAGVAGHFEQEMDNPEGSASVRP